MYAGSSQTKQNTNDFKRYETLEGVFKKGNMTSVDKKKMLNK